jgi:hypothetical protein
MVNSIGAAGSSFDIGRQGLQRSSASIQDSAAEIAGLAAATPQAPAPTAPVSAAAPAAAGGEIVEPLVNINVQQNIFNASAKVVDVGSATVGALIDIKA